MSKIQFTSGTAQLSGESKSILDNIAKTLKDNPHLVFAVAGHTDDRGDYNFNVSLSLKRAQSVRQYLVNEGVTADRLTAKGYGPDKPLASNDTPQGRSKYRCVELVLQSVTAIHQTGWTNQKPGRPYPALFRLKAQSSSGVLINTCPVSRGAAMIELALFRLNLLISR